MQLTKFSLVALFLTARTCQAKVVSTLRLDASKSRLFEDVTNIVTSCYKGRINAVGLAGNLPNTLLRTLSIQHSIPIVLIDNIMGFNDHPPRVPVQFRYKLQVFFIEASNFKQLDALVQKNIRYSIWWNHMASFYILDLSPGCVNAQDYLYLAWQQNILHAKVMCSNHESGRLIFNYNPFKSQAPVPWQWVNVFPGINKHPFTVFSRKYRKNETICDDFEKTRDLGGYIIRVEGIPLGCKETIRGIAKPGEYEFWTVRERILGTVHRALNATARFNNHQRWGNLTEDMEKNTRWIQYTWDNNNLITTYPHSQVGNGIISQFRGHKTQLNKILTVIDVDSRFGVGVVYLITLIFFKLFVHQALVPALLNLVRITCNSGFTNLPNNNAARIYIATLLFFVVTMQGIFQSDLASLLTHNIPLRNVNTIKDLVDMDYKKIYGHYNDRNIFEDSELDKVFIGITNSHDCITPVKHDSSAACVFYAEGGILDEVRADNLHVSTKLIATDYIGFGIRWNWPLERRVNSIIAIMVEGAILEPWDVKCNPIKLSDFQVDELVKNNKDFKIIEFRELQFAFVILGIGLTCATIVFIIEVAMQYKCICRIERRHIQN